MKKGKRVRRALLRPGEHNRIKLCKVLAFSFDWLRLGHAYVVFSDDAHLKEAVAKNKQELLGDLMNVVIPRPNPNGELLHGLRKVFLENVDTSGCANARSSLGERKFEGNVVTAIYYPEDKYFEGDYGE